MARSSKHKLEAAELQKSFTSKLRGVGSEVAAHQILGKLAEKLRASKLGVSFGRDDTPVLRAGFFFEGEDCKPSSQDFQLLTLASIRKSGKLIAGERSVALWKLSELYEHDSPIEFKREAAMSLEEYAFWMRASLRDVEKTFCQEVIAELMKHIKHDQMWRLFSAVDGWLEIDPWKLAIEADLDS